MLFFLQKFWGNLGQGGTKAVLGVKRSTKHSPTEPAKFRHINIFKAKKLMKKYNYFLVQNQLLQHISAIPHDPAKF